MRAYISFEDGVNQEDKGTVAVVFALLDAEGQPVNEVDLTSEAHKMASRSAMLIDEQFRRVVKCTSFEEVAKLAVEAERLGIVKPEEVKAYMEKGQVVSGEGHS